MKKRSFKEYRRHKRVGKWISVNARWIRRKAVRLTQGDNFQKAARGRFAKCIYLSLGVILCSTALLITARFLDETYGNPSVRLTNKLAYDAQYDTNIPYFRTLDHIGSSNHLLLTVETAKNNNIKNIDASLSNGNINLKLTFEDQTVKEIPLKNHRMDNFFAGQTAAFKVTLPFGYTPFDIKEVSLVMVAGADGKFDDWHCSLARLSFLLGDRSVLIAKESWDGVMVFGSGNNQLRSTVLVDQRTENTEYQQTKRLFTWLNALSQNGMTDFSHVSAKQDALHTLNITPATALFIDVETVGINRNSALIEQHGATVSLSEQDEMNYNGVLLAEITFVGKLGDGSFTKSYTLDTPGKDDFEIGAFSTFRLDLPEGTSIFDIAKISLTTDDKKDAWAPRFIRVYTALDFDTELEIARLTDAALEAEYGTAVFYRRLIDQPVTFALNKPQSVSVTEEARIKKDFGHTLTGTSRSMYFDRISFTDRQILFYQQLHKLYSPEKYNGGE